MQSKRFTSLFLLFFLVTFAAHGEVDNESRQGGAAARADVPEAGRWLRPDPETISYIDAYRVGQRRNQITAGYLSFSSKQEDYNPGSSRLTSSTVASGYRTSFFTAGLDPWDVLRIGGGYTSLSGRSTLRAGTMSAFQVEPAEYTEFKSVDSSSAASATLAVAFPQGIGIAVGLDAHSSASTVKSEGQSDDQIASDYSRIRASAAWLLEGHQLGVAWRPSLVSEDEEAPVRLEREVSVFFHYLEGGANLGLGLTHHTWSELDEKYQDKISYTLTSEQRVGGRAVVAIEGTYSPGYYTTYGSLDPETMPKSSFGLRLDLAVTEQFEIILGVAAVAQYRKEIEEQGYNYYSINGTRDYSAAVRGSF